MATHRKQEEVAAKRKRIRISPQHNRDVRHKIEQRKLFPHSIIMSCNHLPSILRQRAFRERKEKHVHELEAKLRRLSTTATSLQSDNERLKALLQRAQTENEILKATVSPTPPRHNPPGFVDDPSLLPSSRSSGSTISDDEPAYDPARLANGLILTGSPPPRLPVPLLDCHLLSASATWDLLQSHPLYLSGAVDIGEVCERIKRMAKCDGTGPMFEEEEVRKIIEDVGWNGSDELI
jgi:AP-1-like factor